MAALPLETTARRLHPLISRIHEIAYFDDEPTDALMTFGYRNYWDCYFAGRSAPLGRVPAEVVDAVFYNFAPGEVARHIPSVWEKATPAQVIAVHHGACSSALRRLLGPLAEAPQVARAADTATKVALGASTQGRVLFAGLRSLPVPAEPVPRLWHSATLLREHRGDGHNAALLTYGIGGLEAHALAALADNLPAHEFGRIHHLPRAQTDAVLDGLRARGLVDASGRLTAAGRETKQQIEDLTDRLAAVAYTGLDPDELSQFVADLEVIGAQLTPEPVG